MKILGWLALILLVACESSLQDKIDEKVRLCGQYRYEPVRIESHLSVRYDAAQRSALRLSSLEGQDHSEFLTTEACLDLPPGDEEYLLTDASTQSFAIVSGSEANVRLTLWTPPTTDWACPPAGFFRHQGQALPVSLDWPYNGKGQSLALELQDVRSDGTVTRLVRSDRGFLLSSDDGSYLAALKLMNPFGTEVILGQACPLSLYSQRPPITFSKEPQPNLVLSETTPPDLHTAEGVDYFYCLSATGEDSACPAERWQNWTAWQLPAEAASVFVHLRAVDRHGNEQTRGPIPATIDRVAPTLKFQWKDPLLNRFGHVERMPFVRYTAKIELADDGSRLEDLEDKLQCRLLVQENDGYRSGASFVTCEEGRCKGQKLDEWVSCSRDFSFHLDPSFWPLYTKDRRGFELIAEVRTEDVTGKSRVDSGLLIINPKSYPDFEGGTWNGMILDDAAGEKLKSRDTLFVQHRGQILQGSFGFLNTLRLPADRKVLRLFASPQRLAATFSSASMDHLLEFDFPTSSWKTLLDGFDGKTPYSTILLPNNSSEAWVVGEHAASIMTRIEGGKATPYACPALQNERNPPAQAALFNEEAFLFYSKYLVTFNLRTMNCVKQMFSASSGFHAEAPARTFHRDEANRIWAFDEKQIDLFEEGQWQHFSRESLGLPTGDFVGASRISPTQMVFFQANGMHFVENYAAGNAVVVNTHNSSIARTLGKNLKFLTISSVFVQNGDLLAVIDGVLVRNRKTNSPISAPDVFQHVQFFATRNAEDVLMTRPDGNAIELSNRSLVRKDLVRPVNVVSSATDDGTMIFGYRDDDITVRKYDRIQDEWREDPAFAQLGFTWKITAPRRDRAGRLWFSWSQSGDARNGNYVYEGGKAERVQPCDLCADAFHESSDGDIYWRANVRPAQFNGLSSFDLFRWNARLGLLRVSGPEQMFAEIFSIASDAGRIAVSGLDQQGHACLGLLAGGAWQPLEAPDAGRSMLALIGWNKKGEFFGFAQNSRVHLWNKGSWSTLKAGSWAQPNSSVILNPFGVSAYYEDQIMWWKLQAEQSMNLYDLVPVTRGQWWWDRGR